MQLAVKEALKEVSIEHNKAMVEQQKRLQKEIDDLRKQLATGDPIGSRTSNRLETSIVRRNDTDTMDTDDQDMGNNAQLVTTSTTLTISSPKHKRPKRSKSRNQRGTGGPSSTNDGLDV
jgi:hypothetical protein